MKAFWWFEDNSVAGMARPGFNCTHWFDLEYDEVVLMGWLGQYSSGSARRQDFHHHMKTYCPKIAKFYGQNETKSNQIAENYHTKVGVLRGLEKLADRTELLAEFNVTDDEISFTFCDRRLDHEISFLKKSGFKKVVTLTEQHHGKDVLQNHFELHHFSIVDLDAPSFDQVLEMAEIIKASKVDKKALAVHCLAGIGRTSTMLIAAHMALGKKLEKLLEVVSVRNPSYKLTGSQADFIHSVKDQLA